RCAQNVDPIGITPQNLSMSNRNTRRGIRTSFVAAVSTATFALFILPAALAQEAQKSSEAPKMKMRLEMLTPDRGVDFKRYLWACYQSLSRHWLAVMPKAAEEGEKGVVVVRLQIQKDGKVAQPGARLDRGSGKQPLDEAALQAVQNSAPFDP